MKKILLILLFVFALQWQSSDAAVAAWVDPVTVYFTDCDSSEIVDIHVDVLVQSDVSTDTVLTSYTTSYPAYESFAFLSDGDYISYRAYIENDIWTNETCEYYVNFDVESYDDFYIVVFESDGTILAQEIYTYEETAEVYMDDEYFFFEYEILTNTITLVQEPMHVEGGYGGWEVLLYFMIGIMILAGIGVLLFMYYVIRFVLRKHVPSEHRKGFYYLTYGTQVVMLYLILRTVMQGWGDDTVMMLMLLTVGIDLIAVIATFILRNKVAKKIPIKPIVLLHTALIIFDLMAWGIVIGFLFD